MKNSVQKGFTLIELMIVIAIIGVLAAVAVPAYQDYLAKGQLAEAASMTGGVKTEVAMIYAADTTCPANAAAAPTGTNIALSTSISGKYILSVTTAGTPDVTGVGGCTVTAKFRGTGVNPKLIDKSILYKLVAGNGVANWTCGTDIDVSLKPKTCTGTLTSPS